MNVFRLLLFLSIGTVAMLIPVMLQGIWYRIKWPTRIVLTVLLTVAGTLGTFVLFYIENGYFGGTSFYGAVFLVPVLFIPVARIFKIRYGELMDLCAPAECAMLVVMKIQCYMTGCCGGVELTVANTRFVFPSQQVELANGLILCVVLLLMSQKMRFRGRIYPWYLVFYGISRFILNIFRKTGIVLFLHMPFGNFWSIISVVIGITMLILIWRKQAEIEVKKNDE